MYNWYKISSAVLQGMDENRPAEFMAGAKKIALLKIADRVYAFAATCPHAGAPMCDGWVNSLGRLVCPLHKYNFDPATGRNTTGEGYKLFTYPIEERNGEIFVGILAP